MRVLIVNTFEKTGGAAIAASRLKEALINNGIKAKMLVRLKETDSLSVVGLKETWMQKFNFVYERFLIWKTNHFSREHLFDIDTAVRGTDITSLPEFKEADVIHLNWINQGFLSMRSLQKIIRSGKPIVWTMHDMWTFTGICHYARDCQQFINECNSCPLLRSGGAHDLSYRVFRQKEKVLHGCNIVFVACSRWLSDQAEQSYLLRSLRVIDIPNPISTLLFKPRDKEKSRRLCRLPLDKKLILFSAFRITSPLKGLKYFQEACQLYSKAHAEMEGQIAIVAVGKDADTLIDKFPYPVYSMGYVDDEHLMASIYDACNAFVIPSLQDNLPNTIVEAMASGVPCIATKVGGIPQMINHKENGYLAEPKEAEDIKRGMEWLFTECDYQKVCQSARSFAIREYSEQSVAMRYIEIYNDLLNKNYE
ncbi:MAG: glycosyltransferase family 4 protein [Bacteroidaceae bacterium]